MPIKDRDLYPDNWPDLADATKAEAGWRCQECGRRCYRPGERVRNWHRVLTVAHLDQDPTNNDSNNLRALCVVCHLEHDRPHNCRKSRRTWALKRAGPTMPMDI